MSETNFEYLGNRVVVPAALDSHNLRLMLDLGATGNVLWDNKYNRTDKVFKTQRGNAASGAKVSARYTQWDSLQFLNVFIENPIFACVPSGFEEESERFDISGLLSGRQLDYLDAVLHIDMDSFQLNVSSSRGIPEDYARIEAKFNLLSFIKIPLQLPWQETPEYYLFDTGYNGFALTKETKHARGILEDSMVEYEGIIGADLSGHIHGKKKYVKSNVQIPNTDIKLQKQWISIGFEVNENIVGMKFIEQFNWIIDYANKQVYLKKNDNSATDETLPRYLTFVDSDTLKVAAIKKGVKSKYRAGDAILYSHNNSKSRNELYNIKDSLNRALLKIEDLVNRNFSGFGKK